MKQAVAAAAVEFTLQRIDDKSTIGIGTCLLYTSDAADE